MHESEKWKWSRSVVSDSSRPHELYVAYQAPPSMGFSRQEYWSGLPFNQLYSDVKQKVKKKKNVSRLADLTKDM